MAKTKADKAQADIIEWFNTKKRTIRTAKLVHDPQVAEGLADAELRMRLAGIILEQKPDDPDRGEKYEEAQAEVAEIKERVTGVTKVFQFRNLPPDQYDELERANRATPEQIEEAKALAKERGETPQIPDLDEEEFSKALVSAASIDPVLDLETVEIMWSHENLTAGERNALFQAARSAQVAGFGT